MNKNNIVSNRLRNLREEKNLTRQQLSDMIGIPYQSILNYELGRRTPNASALAAFEEFFHVSGKYLCGETDIKDPMIWEDQEIMEAIREVLPKQLSDLSTLIINQTENNQKLIFDILVEIKSILTIDDDKEKEFYIDLIHKNIITITTAIARAKNNNSSTTK